MPALGKPSLGEQPKECDDSYPVLVLDVPKVDAPAPKPGLDKHDPVIAGTSPITITGTLLEQVVLIEDGKQSLRFRLSTDKTPSLVLELPDTITKTLGGHTLLVTFADETTATYLVTIKMAEN